MQEQRLLAALRHHAAAAPLFLGIFYRRLSRRCLGPVGIHRDAMTAAARWIMAAKLGSVLSLRIAMRLNSFSLPKKFSIRWRHVYMSWSMARGLLRRGC